MSDSYTTERRGARAAGRPRAGRRTVPQRRSGATGHVRVRSALVAKSRRAAGFTLIEIMVVVVILGILAALVAPNVMRRIDDAQIAKVKQDLQAFETALNLYKLDNYKYPTTDQGLQALISQPNDPTVRNWKPGGYLSGGLRKDPWNNDYIYVNPGTHGGEYDLYTLGADGQEGGEGIDADRGNWTTE